MKLFVGLGNPGSRYAGNRHNIGFLALDAIAHAYRAGPFRARFQGEACEATIDGERVLLLKPLTFMNESGRSVVAAMQFYKIALEDVAVFHDELDLPPAKLRIKRGGGNAGHNGLRSITAHCGNEYRRIRLGIGHPGVKDLVHAYVLGDFARAEAGWVSALCTALAAAAPLIAAGQDTEVQNRVQRAMDAAGFGEVKPVGGAL